MVGQLQLERPSLLKPIVVVSILLSKGSRSISGAHAGEQVRLPVVAWAARSASLARLRTATSHPPISRSSQSITTSK